jgi:hypothetical protein
MMRKSRAINLILAVVLLAGAITARAGTLIDVAFTGASVTSKTGFAATGVSSNDFWNTYVIYSEALPTLEFVDGTGSEAGLFVANASEAGTNGASDPMFGNYLYASAANITLTLTNLTAGVYDVYLYGHGASNNQDSIYQLTAGTVSYGNPATTNGAGWLSSVWQVGVQYVEFSNVYVLPGQTVTIAVEPGAGGIAVISGLQVASVPPPEIPFIITPPANQSVVPGARATFNVLAIGVTPLGYQWLFNGADIPAATNVSYNVTNAQSANAGSYSVVVTNGFGIVTSAPALLSLVAPAATLIDVAFTGDQATPETGFAATGLTSNDFWNSFMFNTPPWLKLDFVDGTSSGAGLAVSGAANDAPDDGAFDPMYASYFQNSPNSSMRVTVTNLVPAVYDFYLYGHGYLDIETSVFDLTVGNVNYGSEATTSTAAWTSPVWQEGVQYVEFTNVSVFPGQTVTITVAPGTSQYCALSGVQMSSVGPLAQTPAILTQPAYEDVIQGSAATFTTVAGGTPPFAYQWLFNGVDIPSATNASYTVTTAQLSNSGNYSVIVTNAYGSITSAVAALAVITPPNTLIDVAITTAPATGKTGLAATGVSTNDFWNTYPISYGSLPNLQFVDGAASGVGMYGSGGIVGLFENGASDPMYGDYMYFQGGSGSTFFTITNLSPGTYDIYVYGHGAANDQNTVVQLAAGLLNYGTQATTTGPGWISPMWQEGIQYVEFTNVNVPVGQSLVLTVEPGGDGFRVLSGLQLASIGPPSPAVQFFISQPSDQAIIQGATATFAIVAGGTPPLTYQWLFDGSNVTAATNNSYTVTNAQPGNAGSYIVIVTNAYGSVTSAMAALSILPAPAPLIDVAFTSASVTGKTGFAATGITSNDFWNTCTVRGLNLHGSGGATLMNMESVNGAATLAGLTVNNVLGVDPTGASDPMEEFYCWASANIFITISNLAAGYYDFYVYGHPPGNDGGGLFQLTVGSQNYGTEATSSSSDWLSPTWQEGLQYVEFTNVNVPDGQTVNITAEFEPQITAGNAVISGLQIASLGPQPQTPAIIAQPPSQSAAEGANATFTVLARGLPPLAYQWLFDNANIFSATNSSYTLTNAQPANAGSYSVIVSNAYGSVTSSVAALNVFAPAATLIDVAFTGGSATGETGFAATGVTTDDLWNTCTVVGLGMLGTGSGALPNMEFADGVPSGAQLMVANVTGTGTNGASDPMYETYLYASYTNITLTIANLIPGSYDFYLYGHGASNNQNSGFQLAVGAQSYGTEATTNGPGWLSSAWQEGVQYVEFTNVDVPYGQAVIIKAGPGSEANQNAFLSGLQIALASPPSEIPFIIDQPMDQSTAQGAIATFSVVAGGEPPFAYQWLFGGADAVGASNSSYTVANAQSSNVGGYCVIVANAYGSVTSAVAALSLLPPALTLMDVAFTGGNVTSKTGFAATGVTTNDFWDTYALNSGTLSNLSFVDGTASDVALTVTNANSAYTDQASDPMYATSLYSVSGVITVTVTNLTPGLYDLYLYGHGNEDYFSSLFQVTSGAESYGSAATVDGPNWVSPVWQDGVQYVEFTNVDVLADQAIIITVGPGTAVRSDAFLSGLQLANIGPPSPSQAVVQGSNATFGIVAGPTPDVAYQWLFNNTNISGATNSLYSIINVQPVDAGNYSVIVTNAHASVTNAVAVLNVLAPGVASVIDVAFTGASNTSKTGFAVAGLTANDFWNSCPINSASLPSLRFTDGTTSGAGVTVANANATYGDSAPDPMFATYLYTKGGNITVTVTNLAQGVYDFYVYGHGIDDSYNSVFQLTGGSQSFGSEATTNGPGWLSSIWQDGVQYVDFTNAIVKAGQTITITVKPGVGGYAVLSGLQMAALNLPANGGPLIVSNSTQFVNANEEIGVTNYAFTTNGPLSFTLASNAPEGSRITMDGIFRWLPTCEQGSSSNLITVWATDSSTPPLSNSSTYGVVIGPCVEVNIGSGVVQAGQSTCLPVSLVSSLGLTNLGFTLAYQSGFLTNWNIARSNSLVAGATARTVDGSDAIFNVGVKGGQVLLGSNVIGSICMDTLPGASAFVPLDVVNMGTAASNNTPITNVTVQFSRVVVIGPEPLLDASLGSNSTRLLTVYGNPGVSYDLLTTTNLSDKNSWIPAGSVILTDLFQVINLGGATNQMQFFRAVEP